MHCGCDTSNLIPIEQAINLIRQTVKPVNEVEPCPLIQALDRILAIDIVSLINVPGYNNSAMDGYAFRHKDLSKHKTFKLIGKSFAGAPFPGQIQAGECIRIMTGAPIPMGADTVIMQENTDVNGNRISFKKEAGKGEAIRLAGSDIKKDSLILKKGKRLTTIDIGLLASLGIEEVIVYRKIKVAVFSTGNELLDRGEVGKNNRIFDSNRPMLISMLTRLKADVIDLGIIKDDKELLKKTFELADAQADCVITSGGVSVGEADYTREVLNETGKINFWKLAIKPGKPLAFGSLKNSLFFGLPGNPVSAAVTFEQIVVPCLLLLAGSEIKKPLPIVATAKSTFEKKPGRTDFQRGFYSVDQLGTLWVEPAGAQSSGVLSCFTRSNCYVVLENNRGLVEKGETVSVQPFDRLTC